MNLSSKIIEFVIKHQKPEKIIKNRRGYDINKSMIEDIIMRFFESLNYLEDEES